MRWLGTIEQALEMLVDRAQKRYAHGSLLSEKQGIQYQQAAKLAALPRESLAEAKRLITGPGREHLKVVIETENATIRRLQGRPANREAVTAFREKRKPDFSTL